MSQVLPDSGGGLAKEISDLRDIQLSENQFEDFALRSRQRAEHLRHPLPVLPDVRAAIQVAPRRRRQALDRSITPTLFLLVVVSVPYGFANPCPGVAGQPTPCVLLEHVRDGGLDRFVRVIHSGAERHRRNKEIPVMVVQEGLQVGPRVWPRRGHGLSSRFFWLHRSAASDRSNDIAPPVRPSLK